MRSGTTLNKGTDYPLNTWPYKIDAVSLLMVSCEHRSPISQVPAISPRFFKLSETQQRDFQEEIEKVPFPSLFSERDA